MMRSRVAACLLAAALGAGTAQALPAPAEVRAAHRASDVRVLDRHGAELHRIRSDTTVRRGDWVALADVSPALRTALVLSEDQRFWQHSGVDWQAVGAAAWANAFNRRTRGASTITMQLAGLLDGDWKAGPGGRSVPQKIGQTVAAQRLEAGWRKDQILEAYLNLVPFRGELVGIDALARTLFAKAPHGLDAREAAVAAALVRAPNAAAPRVAERACAVLRQLALPRECEGIALFTEAVLQRRAWPASDGIAPHLARRVAAHAQAGSVRTTLSAPVQRAAQQALRQQIGELRGRNVADGAAVVLDTASGEVLAWVGGSGTGASAAAEVDHVLAPRQAGSTLKPFLYAQAIAERRLTAASLLEDAPTHIATPAGLYIPQNYDRQFKGWVSVRTALGASLNVPAVRTLVQVGPDAFARQLQAVGIPLAHGGAHYGTSLALGSAEVRLLDLANAYRTLANAGRMQPVRWLAGQPVPPVAQALDARAAFVVADMLADPNARARTFGTDSLLATRGGAAVKTGTSKDLRDNWAVGFGSRYTVAVWVGNAGGEPMHGVSGTSGAAPVWAELVQQLHAGLPARAPRPPAGVVAQRVAFGDGLEAARSEWFLAGTQQALFAIENGAARAVWGRPAGLFDADAVPVARIAAPVDGTVLALDPDIPPERQRLRLAADGAVPADWRWRVRGTARGATARWAGQGAEAGWQPWPGRHVVELLDAAGTVRATSRIEVRGAGVRAGAPS